MTQQPLSHYARLALSMGVILTVAACGGGGSGDAPAAESPPADTTAPLITPISTTVAASATTATIATPATIDTSCGLNGAAGIQAEILQRVNALRAAGATCGSTVFPATTALAWNNQLLQAAAGHSSDMAQNNYFSHTSLDGRTLSQRVQAAGYSFRAVGENIAAGQTSVQSVMTGWINSPGHCQNLMNPNFRDIGVACVRNDAAQYRLYWTMNLGRTP